MRGVGEGVREMAPLHDVQAILRASYPHPRRNDRRERRVGSLLQQVRDGLEDASSIMQVRDKILRRSDDTRDAVRQ